MPKFKYAGEDEAGAKVRGTVAGNSIDGVTTTLIERGVRVYRVKPSRNILQAEITTKKVKRADVMHFSRQLAAFLRAGVPILDALEIVQGEASDKVLKRVLTEMSDALRRGENFSNAAAAHSEVFPPFYVSVLRSAEATGALDVVLEQLSHYIERDLDARHKIRSALAYPAVVMVLSFVTVAVLSGFVLPRFKTFFKSLNAQLPLPTRMLLAVTDFMTAWWWALLGGFALFVLVIFLALQTTGGRHARDRLLLKIPAIGPVVRYAVIERFCRILAAMVETGVPLPEAMHLASNGAHNLVYERALEQVQDALLEGEGLAGPIARTELFPSAVTQMVRVGEDTGTLDQQLEAMAKYYEKELEYKLKNLTTLFEPLVIVFMGVVVGFVAVALVSAMYGVFNQVQI
ncbi:MAG: hypothetical protein QOE35_716 [Actinomycetota bacterium]|jgi:type IV pilus assembly protein PilC